EPVVAAFLAAVRAEPSLERPRVVAFSGTDPDSRAAEVLDRAGARPAGLATDRIVASLEGGLDGFLGRRSAKFRAEARRARRAADASGIVYERSSSFADGALGCAEGRLLAIDRKPWQSAEGSGIDAGPMREFYRRMLPRLAQKGSLRLVFVTRDGADLAFCFGGVSGGVYRGLQASFDHEHAKDSPGVLAHLEMIHLLADEDVLGYDPRRDSEYRRRWGAPGLRTVAYVLAV